jgi:hypothetical protein
VATVSLADLAAGGETLVVPLDSQITAYTYETRVSDHLPVVTVLP